MEHRVGTSWNGNTRFSLGNVSMGYGFCRHRTPTDGVREVSAWQRIDALIHARRPVCSGSIGIFFCSMGDDLTQFRLDSPRTASEECSSGRASRCKCLDARAPDKSIRFRMAWTCCAATPCPCCNAENTNAMIESGVARDRGASV